MATFKLICAAILAVLAVNVAADIKILTPSASYYGVANSTLPITWDYSGTVPQNILIKLAASTPTNTTFVGDFGLATAIPVTQKLYQWNITNGNNFVGDNMWVLKFFDSASTVVNATALATSEVFSIKPAGTAPPSNTTTASSTSTASSTASGTSSAATPSSTENKSDASSLAKSSAFIFSIAFIALLKNVF